MKAKKMGEVGREHAKKNFLILDDLEGYLRFFVELQEPAEAGEKPAPTTVMV